VTTRNFAVVKLIHNSPVLFGRGTRVWIVRDKLGLFYVLKDSWINQQDQVSEIDLIKHVEKYLKEDEDGYLFQHSFPQYYIGQEVVHSTNTVHGFPIDSPGTRSQRRIVTGAIGDPITSFRSKKEFVSVCLDLVNMLDFLDNKAKVIHGDVSINNIMINRVLECRENESPSQLRVAASNGAYKPDIKLIAPPSIANQSDSSSIPSQIDYKGTDEPIEACGMLIDCDFMRLKGNPSHLTSGTLPFMAIEALMSSPTKPYLPHGRHDLEALLNTILTVCHYTEGPGGELRKHNGDGDKTLKLNRWFVEVDLVDLAIWKTATLEAFNTFIGLALPIYWQDFAPYIHRLIEAT
ncbi:hypothetical protein HYPSUDRAFT_120945, partial [Hypholoma sublateritium FD-334 SS-4]